MVNWVFTFCYRELKADKVMMTYTRNGIHLKIYLPRKITFWRCIELRSLLHDDPKRIVFDILRYRSGAKMIDVLWDSKRFVKELA